MRTICIFNDIALILINITAFAFMVGIFIMVFFYPEKLVVIFGQIKQVFNHGLQRKLKSPEQTWSFL